MKLSKDERTALKTGKSKFKTFLLFILFTGFTFPQIPFKGFCKLDSFTTDSGFTRVFSFNVDQNEHSDLLVYSPLIKTAQIFYGNAGLQFNTSKTITFPLEVSVIEPIILPDNMIENYAFTSRKNRSFGIYNFNKSGVPTLISQIKLDSYPENLSVNNNVLDNNFEFLVSGNSYDGLSLIYQKGKRLEQRKISEKKTFQNAKFIDLNSDGAQDIVALNTANNSLHFFFRNSNGELQDLRQLSVLENVISMQVFDINYDGFKDILIGTNKSIKIYFGDSFASFNNTSTIPTLYQPDKFVYGDFNRDGFFDFNYLNIENGIISTIFAKDFYTYYPEFIQRQENGLVDLIPFYSKFVYGTAYLNTSGKISILSKVNSMSDNQQFAVVVKPTLISTFDNSSNGIKDLVYKDSFDGSLKFIIRDVTGLPDKIFAVKLFEDNKTLVVVSKSKNIKVFFLYSYGKRVIETVEINFDNYTFTREYFYAEGGIEDLIIKTDINNEPELFILYDKNNVLNLQVASKNQAKYNSSIFKNLAEKYRSPFFTSVNVPAIEYWSTEKDNFILYNLLINKGDYKKESKLNVTGNNQATFSKSSMHYDKNELVNISFLLSENEFRIVKDNILSNKIDTRSSGNKFRITDKNQLFFGKNNSIFIYSKAQKSFSKITPNGNKKDYIMQRIFSDLELSNYTIQNLDQRNMHLVFSNSYNNTIEIRQLPK